MGLAFSGLRSWWSGPKPVRILMLGLDYAGKTAILYRMKLGKFDTTIPSSINYNVEELTCRDVTFCVLDASGTSKMRALWHYYYQDCESVIFVVDAADVDRIEEAREALDSLLEHEKLRDANLLVLANKQDLPDVLATDVLEEKLGLKSMTDRKWHLQPTSAATPSGLTEALEWLHSVTQK